MVAFWIVWLIIVLSIWLTFGVGLALVFLAVGAAIHALLKGRETTQQSANTGIERRFRELEYRLSLVEDRVSRNVAKASTADASTEKAAVKSEPPVAHTPIAPASASTASPKSELPRQSALMSSNQPVEVRVQSPVAAPKQAVPIETPSLVDVIPQPSAKTAPPSSPLDAKNLEPQSGNLIGLSLPPLAVIREMIPAPVAKLIFDGSVLVRVGVLILFLGLIFLLRYTAEHVTVPISLRYTGIAMTGVGLLLLGWFLRLRRPDYALVVQGAGIGVLYLTTLAAIRLHGLIDPALGFTFLFAVTVLGAALAILQDAAVLAIIAAIEGFLAPALVSTGASHPLGLFSYLAVLNIGVALIAWFKAWRPLNLIAFIGTATLASAWGRTHYSDEYYAITQGFLLFFFALFSAVSVLFARRTLLSSELDAKAELADQAAQTVRLVGRVDSALTFGVPFSAYALQYLLLRDTEFGAAFAALGYGLFYLVLAWGVLQRGHVGLHLLAEACVIVGAIFGTLAIPLGLEGKWTGAAWAVEAAGMYWLGLRQQRIYARLLAFPVLIGASWKLLQEISFQSGSELPLLAGSMIGPLILSVSALAVWNLQRQAPGLASERMSSKAVDAELKAGAILPWLGIASLNLLPWLAWHPVWAAVGSATLALMTDIAARRWAIPSLRPIVGAQQFLAVGAYLATLHLNHGAGEAVLGNGGQGMIAAVWIAATIIATTVRALLETRQTALAEHRAAQWPQAQSLGIVVGVTLLHLAMLFAANWQQAAWIWPLTSCLVAWGGLRLGHPPLVLLAAIFQCFSAVLADRSTGDASFVMNETWLTYMALALSGLLEAYWIARLRDRPGRGDASYRMLNPWCGQAWAVWLPLGWGLAWWLGAWITELVNLPSIQADWHLRPQATAAVFLISTAIMSTLARWRSWPELGAATLILLPGLSWCAAWAVGSSSGTYLPSNHGGWLVWPLALFGHFRLLSAWRADWAIPSLLATAHVFGFWFFLLLGASEVRGRLAILGDPATSWPVLGWVLVPALALWSLQTAFAGRRWPLMQFRNQYLGVACLPIALWMLGWLWLSNLNSGDSAPLPYLPVLNPLELGQWIVLAAWVAWLRAVEAEQRIDPRIIPAILGMTALALVSGAVLRTCHHFGDVQWTLRELFHSRMAQAALSVVWATCAVSLMLISNRRNSRTLWMAGAALLAVVVLKLFAVELSDQGGIYRIVSFIGVGVLLLLVGYFASVPATTKGAAKDTP
jgi:uncharacterized membrane protein